MIHTWPVERGGARCEQTSCVCVCVSLRGASCSFEMPCELIWVLTFWISASELHSPQKHRVWIIKLALENGWEINKVQCFHLCSVQLTRVWTEWAMAPWNLSHRVRRRNAYVWKRWNYERLCESSERTKSLVLHRGDRHGPSTELLSKKCNSTTIYLVYESVF